MYIRQKVIRILFLSFILLALAAPTTVSAVSNYTVSRVINIVYDDSGSMIDATGRGQLVDRWCQAKYAMEVFAAMLGENDTMNIYYMSDFDRSTDAGPKITLYGSDSQAANVAKIHNTVTNARNTPFNTVRKAYADLLPASADEKWLVILTDGEFQGFDAGFFDQKSPEVSVMFLGMGPDAGAIRADPGRSIYYEKAETSSQILNKITDICTMVFNSNRLDVNVSSKSISFDVPMAELTVFAQGANVSINGVGNATGKTYLSSTEPVTVQYSEEAAPNYPNFIVARDLKGSIATFKDDFTAGSYTLDVSGADTIEVYYKPNIEIAIYLTDASGTEVTSMENLEEGEYTIDFGFVKAGTDEKIGQSSLLGDVSYAASVTNGGAQHDRLYGPGDRISLREGPLEIDATAYYLKYNSVSTSLSYTVYRNQSVGFALRNDPQYVVNNDGADFSAPIQLELLAESGALSAEQWAALPLPEVRLADESDREQYGAFTVEKDAIPGVFNLYPSLAGKELSAAAYGDFDYIVSLSGNVGAAVWNGSAEETAHVTDARTRISRLTIVENPEYEVTTAGLDADLPIQIKAEFDGQAMTPEYWEKMGLLDVTASDEEESALYGPFTVEKSGTPGIYNVYPSLRWGLMSSEVYESYDFDASYAGGNGTAEGADTLHGTVKIMDQRSWFERNLQLLIRVAILAAIALLILGYIPPFKKYLPKRLKRRPTIDCSPNQPGVHQATASGRLTKRTITRLIPYKAEEGTIKFVPPGVPGVPTMQVRAAGGNAMYVTNTKAYAGKEHITFNGAYVEEGKTKPVHLGAGAMISVNTKEMTYTCIPNQ